MQTDAVIAKLNELWPMLNEAQRKRAMAHVVAQQAAPGKGLPLDGYSQRCLRIAKQMNVGMIAAIHKAAQS
jgi:hypothetical protein